MLAGHLPQGDIVKCVAGKGREDEGRLDMIAVDQKLAAAQKSKRKKGRLPLTLLIFALPGTNASHTTSVLFLLKKTTGKQKQSPGQMPPAIVIYY